MTTAIGTPGATTPRVRAPRWMAGILCVFYVLVVLLTQPESHGDTRVYAEGILLHDAGKFQPGADPLWEFGHLLWRPLGYVALKLENGILDRFLADSPLLKAHVAMMSISTVLSGVAFLLVYLIALSVSGSWVASLLASLLFLFANTVLNYMQSGTSYVSGITFQLLGLYLVTRACDRGSWSTGSAIGAGVSWAVSICFWFPYVLTVPGLLLFAWLTGRSVTWKLDREGRRRLRYLVILCASLSVATAAVYGFAMVANHIDTVEKFQKWFNSSRHGIVPNKRYIRVATGLPRSFFNLGEDGVILKRFVLKDPYVTVSIFDIFTASLWKIVAVFSFLLTVVIYLWRTGKGRSLLIPFLAAFSATVLFAAFAFEPSSSERYLPFYAVLLPGFAVAFQTGPRPARWLMILFLASVIVVNFRVMSGAGIEARYAEAIARTKAMKPEIRPHSYVAMLTYRDDALKFRAQLPFHELNRRDPVPMTFVIEMGGDHTPVWGREVRRWAMVAWGQGGDLWISRRLLAERPEPGWLWVEGDDPRLKWTELPSFFRTLDLGRTVGGTDGFSLVLPTEANRERLNQLNETQSLRIKGNR